MHTKLLNSKQSVDQKGITVRKIAIYRQQIFFAIVDLNALQT